MGSPENNSTDQLLNSRHYKHDHKPPEESVLLKIGGQKIGTLGNFVAISGLPKSGKSTFVNSMIASAFIQDRVKFGIQLSTASPRELIGYFDTESAEYDFYKNLERIKKMSFSDRLHPYFNAFNTRQDTAQDNRNMIEYYINNYPVSIVFIDGLLDLITDYNDPTESRMLIDWLKRITTVNKVLIVAVIHTGKKDGHTLGHLGSMVDRYAQSILEVTKHKETGIYSLSGKYLRSAVKDFDPVHIQFTGTEYAMCTAPPPR